MIDVGARDRVDTLLGAVKDRPAELPLAEVIGLAGEPVTVSIDRRSEQVVVVITPRPGALFDPLSGREYEVATLVAAGFSNRQIANTLFISLATVKDHVHAILAKTGCPSRSAVAAAWYGAPAVDRAAPPADR